MGRHKPLEVSSRRPLESGAGEGKSPVREGEDQAGGSQSTTGHEESGGKPGGPPSKPKYYLMTDSGIVL